MNNGQHQNLDATRREQERESYTTRCATDPSPCQCDICVGIQNGGRVTFYIGSPELANGARYEGSSRRISHPNAGVFYMDYIYISIMEAIYLEIRGEHNVAIEWEHSPLTENDLKPRRERARKCWANDHLPDGWTNPTVPSVIPAYRRRKRTGSRTTARYRSPSKNDDRASIAT